MPAYYTKPDAFSNLKNQVVVLTGGAHGVGESIAKLLYRAGAHVIFGDIDAASGQKVIEEARNSQASTGTLHFRVVDVRSYEDNLGLFQLAFDTHGRVDHALSVAGVTEGQNWFDATLDLESIKEPPSTSVLDINLLGALYFARIAAVYLRQDAGSGRDKSLLLFGSLASFKEQAGLFVYQPSKHGVMGLFRSTRKNLHSVHGIRVNIVCPSMIGTGMSARILHIWEEHGLPINSPDQVGEYAVTLTAQPRQEDGTVQTGLAVFVEGGKGWELESELERLEPQWMSEELAHNSMEIGRALGVGLGWTTDRPEK